MAGKGEGSKKKRERGHIGKEEETEEEGGRGTGIEDTVGRLNGIGVEEEERGHTGKG